ncbi:MAG: glycosyltransferase family 2 protein [Microscillaceae bacterium]|nr:glycosyltransferase family 2 protein [Microscillaceae bacterium]
MKPSVSVVITAYNTEKYVSDAIHSVLQQTYTDYELIIVEDGSRDRTREIIENICKQDPRIRFIANEKNRGMAYSANLAIEEAQGEIIIRMDADDVMVPTRIEEQVHHFKDKPYATMISCFAEYISAKNKLLKHYHSLGAEFNTENATRKAIENGQLIQCIHTGFAAYKQAFLDVGGYRNLPCVVDIDIFTRMAEKGHNLYVIPKTLVKYRLHGSSVVSSTLKDSLNANVYAWVFDSYTRRQAGLPEQSLEAFIDNEKKRPFLPKIEK